MPEPETLTERLRDALPQAPPEMLPQAPPEMLPAARKGAVPGALSRPAAANHFGAGQPGARASLPGAWLDSLLLAGLALLLFIVWMLAASSVTVTVDGVSETVRTRRATVGALLGDLGFAAGPLDRISPPPETLLGNLARSGGRLTIERARPVHILADGRDIAASTWGPTVSEALTDAGILFGLYDRVQMNGTDATLETPLPAPMIQTDAGAIQAYGWQSLSTVPVQIRLRRALPITVDEGSAPYVVQTTAQTVGEALREADVLLYLGDRVEPSLGTGVVAGLRVHIQRSTPVTVQVGNQRLKTRTPAGTVGDALSALDIVAAGLDRVEPPLETPLYPDIEIRITRIREDVEIEETIEPFETIYQGDPSRPIDTQFVVAPGAAGIERQRYRVRYENGEQVARVLEDSWLAQSPAPRIITYGQQITPQTAVIDGQEITYWRKVRMLATSYSAQSAGGNRTFTGDTLRPGIVAIDPKIVPLRSRVYVPGYGFGDALDTGGGIRSRRIDLSYDDASFVSVLRWTDVYLLWPPPSADRITWVVPNFPRVPE